MKIAIILGLFMGYCLSSTAFSDGMSYQETLALAKPLLKDPSLVIRKDFTKADVQDDKLDAVLAILDAMAEANRKYSYQEHCEQTLANINSAFAAVSGKTFTTLEEILTPKGLLGVEEGFHEFYRQTKILRKNSFLAGSHWSRAMSQSSSYQRKCEAGEIQEKYLSNVSVTAATLAAAHYREQRHQIANRMRQRAKVNKDIANAQSARVQLATISQWLTALHTFMNTNGPSLLPSLEQLAQLEQVAINQSVRTAIEDYLFKSSLELAEALEEPKKDTSRRSKSAKSASVPSQQIKKAKEHNQPSKKTAEKPLDTTATPDHDKDQPFLPSYCQFVNAPLPHFTHPRLLRWNRKFNPKQIQKFKDGSLSPYQSLDPLQLVEQWMMHQAIAFIPLKAQGESQWQHYFFEMLDRQGRTTFIAHAHLNIRQQGFLKKSLEGVVRIGMGDDGQTWIHAKFDPLDGKVEQWMSDLSKDLASHSDLQGLNAGDVAMDQDFVPIGRTIEILESGILVIKVQAQDNQGELAIFPR